MNVTHKQNQTNIEGINGNHSSKLYGTGTAIRLTFLSLIVALVIGGAIRLVYVTHGDFPLNDGGLFFTMTEDLRTAIYSLPPYTSYNGGEIPYAYPPLAFYLNAALEDALSISGLTAVRVITFTSTSLLIISIYLFGQSISMSSRQISIAVIAYATLPASFEWLVTGGGLTRAPALLFTVLMLLMVHQTYTNPRPRNIILAALFGSLTLLTHPATSIFAAYSAGLLFLFYGRSWRTAFLSLLIAITILIASSPWWLSVILMHGPMPLLYAMRTGEFDLGSLAPLIFFNFSGESILQVMAVVGLIGMFICIADRTLLLPIWTVATFVLSPRGGSTYAAIPLALLVGIGMDRAVLPSFERLDGGKTYQAASLARRSQMVGNTALGLFLGYALVSALMPLMRSDVKATALQPEERQAMAWVAAHTPANSRFLVVTGQENWAVDRVSEWFPSLTNRISLNTVQGSEWLPTSGMVKLQNSALQLCSTAEASCLKDWSETTGLSYQYIYIPYPHASMNISLCCSSLLMSLNQTPGYIRIYDGPGAIIFARQ